MTDAVAGSAICFRFDRIPVADVEAKADRVVAAVLQNADDRVVALHSATPRSPQALARFARLGAIRIRPFEPEPGTAPARWPLLTCRQVLVTFDDPSVLPHVFRRMRRGSRVTLHAYSRTTHDAALSTSTARRFIKLVAADPMRFGWCLDDEADDFDWFDEWIGFPTRRPPPGDGMRREITTWGRRCPPDLLRAAIGVIPCPPPRIGDEPRASND